MVKVKLHYHKIIVDGDYFSNLREICHPVSTKHRHPRTQMYHDIKTGKFNHWRKKNKLRLVKSTYNKYLRKLKKK